MDPKNVPITMAGFVGMPPTVKSPDHKNIYINAARVGIAPYDVRLICGQVVEGAEVNSNVNEDLVTVIFSPQQAKVVARMLSNAIQQYETLFGPVSDVETVLRAAQVGVHAAGKPS